MSTHDDPLVADASKPGEDSNLDVQQDGAAQALAPSHTRGGSGQGGPKRPQHSGDGTSSHRHFSLGIDRFSGLYLWAIFIIIFGIWTPHLFLSLDTVHSVASGYSIVAIMALAVLIPFSAGVYDLSIGAVVNLSAIIVCVLQDNYGWPIWSSILVAVGTCFVIGVLNGLIVVKFHVNSFIATLGMMSIVEAVQIIISGGGQPNPPTDPAWSNLTQTTFLGFQVVVFYLLAFALIAWWVMDHTPVGRYLYAVGGNSEAARLSGVNVDKWIWLSLITSATVTGVAGVLYASLSGPSLTFGSALLLPAFAAVFLGSTQLRPGRFNVWGTMIAVYVLATGIEGLLLVTSVTWLSYMFNGVALILAVSVAVWRQSKAKERA